MNIERIGHGSDAGVRRMIADAVASEDVMISIDEADVVAMTRGAGDVYRLYVSVAGDGKYEKAAAEMSSGAAEILSGSNSVIICIKSDNCTLTDVYNISSYIENAVDPDARIVFGAAFDDDLTDTVNLTVFAANVPEIFL